MTNDRFYTGQTLTARDLNSAFQSIAGIRNPSDDYKWQQTSLGRMQTGWNTYGSGKAPSAGAFDIRVELSKPPKAATYEGKELAGVRRVFMNVGPMSENVSISYGRIAGEWYPLGSFNGIPWAGVMGMQVKWRNSILEGDNRPEFSILSFHVSHPGDVSSPESWVWSQKLYQDTGVIVRNRSPLNWWWTGLTLEYCSNINYILGSKPDWMDLMVFPLLVKTESISGNPVERKCAFWLPYLVVCTKFDYVMTMNGTQIEDEQTSNQLKEALQQTWAGLLTVQKIKCVVDPACTRTIAKYQYNESFFTANYLKAADQVNITKDMSPGKVIDYLSLQSDDDDDHGPCYSANVQWIDRLGKHRSKQVTDLALLDREGAEVDITDYACPVAAALVAAYNPEANDISLSCFQISDNSLSSGGDIVQEILSAYAPGLSAVADAQKRLVWVDYGDGLGTQTYDACPDFSGHGKAKGNFEPVFGLDKQTNRVVLSGVGQGFLPFGAKFIGPDSALSVDKSAKIGTGCIWIEIDTDMQNDNISAYLVGGQNWNEADFSNTGEDGVFCIPMYSLLSGQIDIDFRSCMSMPVRIM